MNLAEAAGRHKLTRYCFNNEIIISGGFGDKYGGHFLSSVVAFNPNANTNEEAWRTLPDLPEAMIFPMIVSVDQELHLIGGTVPQGRGHGSRNIESGYVLSKDSAAWEPTELQPNEFFERVIVQAGGNQWLALGGRLDDDSLTSSIQIIQK